MVSGGNRFGVAFALAGFVLMAGACSGSDSLETAPAAEQVATIIADNSGEDTEIATCPLDPNGVLLSEALAGVDSTDAALGLTLPRTAFVGTLDDQEGSTDRYVSCDRFDDDSESSAFVGLAVSNGPTDFDEYVTQLTLGNDEEFRVNKLATTEHRDGTIERFCVADLVDPEFGWCEATWFDENLQVSLYVTGASTGPPSAEQLEEGLIAILDRVVDNLTPS